jgi:hypothetical protein
VKVLWVATKPPWPPTDGGRLVSALTIEALHAAGQDLTLLAPVGPNAPHRAEAEAHLEAWCRPILVAASPASLLWAGLRSLGGRTPTTVRRHAIQALREQAARLTAREGFDVVHAEQVQALAQCDGLGVPIVMRAQNVESDLWRGAARGAGLFGPWLRREASRLAAWEGAAVRRTASTVALTAPDAARLALLSGAPEKTRVVPAPFPARLPPAEEPLPGAPVVVVLGSAGWRPNREGTAWFLTRVWPLVKAGCPGAILYLFGGDTGGGDGVVVKPAPSDSREAFPPASILAVPLHVASGVRMKILEAWARGVPVVATPEAAAGLEAAHGRELLIAGGAPEFAEGIRRLHAEPRLAAALVEAGRRLLAAVHAPEAVAARLVDVYSAVLSAGSRKKSSF